MSRIGPDGRLRAPVNIDVQLSDGGPQPLMVACRDWAAAVAWLRGPECRALLPRVEFITLNVSDES